MRVAARNPARPGAFHETKLRYSSQISVILRSHFFGILTGRKRLSRLLSRNNGDDPRPDLRTVRERIEEPCDRNYRSTRHGFDQIVSTTLLEDL